MEKWLVQVLLFSLSFMSLRAQSIQDLANAAGEENAKGNYLKAIELYSLIIAADPTNSRWYYYRGQDFNMISDNKGAESDYSRAIALDPQYYDAYLSRAILYYSLDQAEKSINDYNQALRYLPDEKMRVFIYNNRGNAKVLRKDFDGAYKDFLKAYTIEPESITTLDNMGKILNRLERGDEALFYFRKMLELDSTNLSAHSDLGYTFLNLQRFHESIEQYNKVLIKNPNSPLALSNRGLAKMNLSDFIGALDDANRAIQLYPQSAYAFRNRGLIHVAMSKRAEGCADFKQALQSGFTHKYDSEVEELYKHYCSTTKF